MEPILRIENIDKYYGNKSNLTKALSHLSLNIDKGEFVAIMGAVSYTHLDVYKRQELSLKATESWQRGFPLEAARGKIYDSQQKVLVDNLTTSSLIIVPSQVKDPVNTAVQLAKILGCSEAVSYTHLILTPLFA